MVHKAIIRLNILFAIKGENMSVVTRFAPAPTGFLHIGGARTALFNWLYARHFGGKFLLRIEDTDRERSTQGAIDAILTSLKWLELDWDGEVVFQFSRASRHLDVAQEMLNQGKAYHCYCSPQEVEEMREKARAAGLPPRYDGRCRHLDSSHAPQDRKPVVRFKMPQGEGVTLGDLVQGDVTVENKQLDDLIIGRADGTPTYMLSVVVDDHDMGVTHIIRGDDHLTNAFRQIQMYKALGWNLPHMAHIPLIHGSDGAKLSKRHGALGVDAYQDMGLLPESLCNYLARLGWSHGDDEIFSRKQAIDWFGLDHVGRSPARFDMMKLENLNAHYIREADDARLLELIQGDMTKCLGKPVDENGNERLLKGMPGLKQRAKTLGELADNALFYVHSLPLVMEPKAAHLLNEQTLSLLKKIIPLLKSLETWTAQSIEESLREYGDAYDIKLGNMAQPLRAALTGRTISPGIFEVMEVFGQVETMIRLKNVIKL